MNYDDLEILKNKIREQRKHKCFDVLANKCEFWWKRLSNYQYGELEEWYQKWLDATDTLICPDDIEWINNKVSEEEVI